MSTEQPKEQRKASSASQSKQLLALSITRNTWCYRGRHWITHTFTLPARQRPSGQSPVPDWPLFKSLYPHFSTY